MPVGFRRFALVLCLVSGSAGSAFAQSNAGLASLQVPVGARAEAMGRAYGVLDSGAFSPFWNVAGIGFVQGLDVGFSSAQLVPDLADDVHHHYFSAVFGANVAKGSTPINLALGLNVTRLNYGESIATDPGSPDGTSTFEATERTWGFAFGAGIADIVAAGVQVKSANVELGPLPGNLGEAKGSTTVWDYGFQLKSPRLPGEWNGGTPTWTVIFKGGIGWSNNGDDIVLLESRAGDPTPYVRSESVGLDFGWLRAADYLDAGSGSLAKALAQGYVVNLRLAFGREVDLVKSEFGRQSNVNQHGFEASLLDLLFIRWGNLNDPSGGIKGATYGFGVNAWNYVGYDYAVVPQFRELDHVKKHSVWIRVPLDPFPAN